MLWCKNVRMYVCVPVQTLCSKTVPPNGQPVIMHAGKEKAVLGPPVHPRVTPDRLSSAVHANSVDTTVYRNEQE